MVSEELRSEYDFSDMKGAVRGKHAVSYCTGASWVLLDPDVAEVFKGTQAVNDALRALIGIARTQVQPASKRRNPRPANREAVGKR